MILQPQGGIDVTGGRRGAHDAPVGAVQILPGQLLTGVDLLHQLLTLVRGAGDEQGAVGHGLLVGSLGGLTVVPVLGIVGILAQAVAGSGQNDLSAVIVQHIGAAGNQTHIDGTGLQAFAHRLVGGADSDLHIAHFVAQLGQLVLQHLLQGLGSGDDLLRLAGRHESDLQRLDLLGAVGIVGAFGIGLVAAACQQAQRHDQHQQKRNDLFHLFSSIVVLLFLRTGHSRRTPPQCGTEKACHTDAQYSTPSRRKFFCFGKKSNILRLSKKPVIASQCAHWRGNPFPKRIIPALFRRFPAKRLRIPTPVTSVTGSE